MLEEALEPAVMCTCSGVDTAPRLVSLMAVACISSLQRVLACFLTEFKPESKMHIWDGFTGALLLSLLCLWISEMRLDLASRTMLAC